MKVTFIIGALGGGGAERVITNLVKKFEDRGVDASIITIYGDFQTYEVDARAEVIHLQMKSTSFGRHIYTLKQLRKEIIKNNPDIIVSFIDQVNIHVALAYIGLKKKPKLLFSTRNDPHKDPRQRIYRIVRDIVYRTADAVVFQTELQKEYFCKKLSKNALQTIIENPVKEGLPNYAGKDSLYFLAAGRLVSQKNYKVMIDAFKIVHEKHQEYELHIYGEGKLYNELVRYIADLELSKVIKIFHFTDKIHDFMAGAKGYLLSSDYEGISNSMLEALAIGVPTVSTDYPSGGARKYIKNGKSGYLVNCGDSKAFAEAVIDIIEHNDKAIKMAQSLFELRNSLSADAITERWIQFISDVIE